MYVAIDQSIIKMCPFNLYYYAKVKRIYRNKNTNVQNKNFIYLLQKSRYKASHSKLK